MLHKKVMFYFVAMLVFVIIFVTFTNSLITISFNNSLSTENLTFTTNENITRYLDIYRFSNVTRAFLNLSSLNATSNLNNPYLEIGIPDGVFEWSVRGAFLQGTDAILNELNDTSAILNLTFAGNENKTIYINIPKHSNTTLMFLNLSGFQLPKECYQETANISTTCGGLSSGSYTESNTSLSSYISLLINYSIPMPNITLLNTNLWQVKLGGGIITNVTLNTCSTVNNVYQFRLSSQWGGTSGNTRADCYNGTDFVLLHEHIGGGSSCGANICEDIGISNIIDGNWDTQYRASEDCGLGFSSNNFACNSKGRLYEEAMIWNMSTEQSVTNVSLDIGIDRIYEWNYTDEFSQINNKTFDLSSAININLTGCIADLENYCQVPLQFHSDTAGIIQISDIIINYTNISKTLDFRTILNNILNNGGCEDGTIIGNNCSIEFLFSSDSAGILNYDDISINWFSEPIVNLTEPLNDSISSLTQTFSCDVSDGIELSNITFYLWNSTNDIVNNTETTQITGFSNSTSVDITFSVDDTYHWNCLVYNSENNFSFATNNFTHDVDLINPVTNLNNPANNFYSSTINIEFNYTPEHSNGIDTCRLYSNFNGTFSINLTDTSITNNAVNTFNQNVSEANNYLWNIWCNSTATGNEEFGVGGNRTLNIDLTFPNSTINSIVPSSGSQTFTFNHTTVDLNIVSCKYSIFNSSSGVDGLNENISMSCGDGLENSPTVTAFGTFNLTIYAIDLAGNENSTTQTFVTSAASAPPPSGGGSDTIIIIIGQNVSWSVFTDTLGNRYDFVMSEGGKRVKNIILQNKRDKIVNIDITCEDVTGEMCKFITFDRIQVDLAESVNVEEIVEFILFINEDVPDGTYDSNIVATDQEGNRGVIAVRVRLGIFGFISALIDKIIGVSEFNLSFLSDELDAINVPNIIILLLPLILLVPTLQLFVKKSKFKIFAVTFVPLAISLVLFIFVV